MKKIIVRWNVGKTTKEGFDCLKYSIKKFKHLYKDYNIEYFICFNDIEKEKFSDFKDMNLINNQRFVIDKIGPLQMTIQDDLGNTRDIYNNDFQKYFLVAYATTIHSAQGLSIGENYTIHEWDRLDERLKYVSLSRARNYENIHIME